ncbi:MAG: ribbon-helix-helix protein, CopG family [Nitrospirota bacterium]
MVRTQIQLTEKQSKSLKKIAASRHLSVAELIRQSVDNMIKSASFVDIEERRRRALAAVGRFSSGLRDLSREHDKYLAEAFENK